MYISKIKTLFLFLILFLSLGSNVEPSKLPIKVRKGVAYELQDIGFFSKGDFSTINSTAIEEFIDNICDEEILNALFVPGLVISAVQNNETLFVKGFGQANLSSTIPINPNKTIFRAGSVSKTFVATAVMQLYEKGLLNLTTDINTYLPTFKIPNTYPNRSITFHHLLTHTAGLDEVWNHTYLANSSSNLEEYLATNLPKRIYAPGEVFCYSNYGYALAGYLVEVITGVQFDQYVKINIFDPLGMNSSGFKQPIHPNYLEDLAPGYYLEDGELTPLEPLLYFMAYPAGSLYTTASDMSKFIIAHLNEGIYNNSRILNSTTIHLMQSLQFTHHPRLGGYCYGFYEYIDHVEQNITTIHHAGDLYGFASELVLIPELKLGFFLSHNSISSGFREYFLASFYDRFFPSLLPQPVPTQDFSERKHLYEGIYWFNRYPHEKYEQGEFTDSIPYSTVELSVNEPSETLKTTFIEFGETYDAEWVEIEPFLFQLPQTDVKMALIPIDNNIQYIVLGLAVYERQEIDHSSTIQSTSPTTSVETTTSKTRFPELMFLLIPLSFILLYRKKRMIRNK